MAGQRTLGLNAIRSNPNIVGYSLTGAVDQVMCGEGLTTLFRELKPGTIDALFDAWAPLRWCLFAEPVPRLSRIARPAGGRAGQRGRALAGQVPGAAAGGRPRLTRVLDRTITVTIPEPDGDAEPPLAWPCFAEDVVDRRPAGQVPLPGHVRAASGRRRRGGRVLRDRPGRDAAGRDRGGALGRRPELAEWLAEHGIRTPAVLAPQPPGGTRSDPGSGKPAAPGGAEAFRRTGRRIARGSTVVFLSPGGLRQGRPAGRLAAAGQQGHRVTAIRGWLYLKDEWAKRHPIFEGCRPAA